MSDRHYVMAGQNFWSNLEFTSSGWLYASEDASLRKYWIDGLEPEQIVDTQFGVDIEGLIWLMTDRDAAEYRFRLSIPQRFLYKPITSYSVEDIRVDDGNRVVELMISKVKNVAEQAAASDC